MDTKNKSRRRLLIGTNALMLGGVASTIPAQWLKPVVNSVILPSHADTSQAVAVTTGEPEPCNATGLWIVKDTSAGENDPGAPLLLNADHSGLYDNTVNVTWKITGQIIALTFNFPRSVADVTGTMSEDCQSFSGEWGNDVTNASGTWEAHRA